MDVPCAEARKENKEFFLAACRTVPTAHFSSSRHTHMRGVDVPNSEASQGYEVMTLMVMDDVDTPSHRPNSLKERTNTHKYTQSMKYVNVMVTAGSSG